MEWNILLDNFASLIVRQAIRFPLVGEHPKPGWKASQMHTRLF